MSFVYFSFLLLVSFSVLKSKYDEARFYPSNYLNRSNEISERQPVSCKKKVDKPVEWYKKKLKGVKYASIGQEVSAARSAMQDDENKKKYFDEKTSSAISNRSSESSYSQSIIVEDYMNKKTLQSNRINFFFKNRLWEDSTFRKSLLKEYRDFFSKEEQNGIFSQKVITIQSSKFKKALIDFKKVYKSDFEEKFNPYVVMINEIVSHMNPSLSEKLKRDRVEPAGLTIICSAVGSSDFSYQLAYKGYQGDDIFVTEKSMYLLFGDELVNQLKKDKLVTLFIPYKNGLDMLVENTKTFSVSLLREKSRCVKQLLKTNLSV